MGKILSKFKDWLVSDLRNDLKLTDEMLVNSINNTFDLIMQAKDCKNILGTIINDINAEFESLKNSINNINSKLESLSSVIDYQISHEDCRIETFKNDISAKQVEIQGNINNLFTLASANIKNVIDIPKDNFINLMSITNNFCDSLTKEMFWAYLRSKAEGNGYHWYKFLLSMRRPNNHGYDTIDLFNDIVLKRRQEKLIALTYKMEDGLYLDDALGQMGYHFYAFCNPLLENPSDEKREISFRFLCDECKDTIVILCGASHTFDELENKLIKEDFPRGNIFRVLNKWEAPIYFEPDIMKPNEHEIFVDAGSFDGSDTFRFISWCNMQYDKIYVFEPDKKNYNICKERFASNELKNISLINGGLWHENTVMQFSDGLGDSSKINDKGKRSVDLFSLDELLRGAPVTLIKMDIEGAELNALRGMAVAIKSYRPKLAISVYHKRGDVLNIPLYLRHLVPDYKFYLRHYSTCLTELVLYAI